MYRLVIADDDEILLEGLSTAIDWEKMDLTVAAAVTDGMAALDFMRSEPCDLLLTDIKMGRMDGLELARAVRDEFQSVRVIMMSAYEDFNFARQAVSLGVEDYLLKPLNLELLYKTVTKVVNELRQQRLMEQEMAHMSRRVEELGTRSVEEFYRASRAVNTAIIDHLCKVTLLGNVDEVSIDAANLRQNLLIVSGGSFVYMVSVLGMVVGRLINSEMLTGEQAMLLDNLQKDALRRVTLDEAIDLMEACLRDIADQIAAQAQDAQALMSRARAFVDANFAQSSLRVKDVASYVGLSVNYFSALFARHAGESFTDYLTRRRMDEAMLLLANTLMKSYEIAYKVGYDNPPYFSTIFKRYTGMTVSQYRETFGRK